MVFSEDTPQQELIAKEVDDQSGDDKPVVCDYNPGGPDCIVCTTENTYIDSSQTIVDGKNIKFAVVDNNGSGYIKGLDPSKSYWIVSQYENGTKRSQCIKITPSDNNTLTELNGAKKAKMGDPRCFIVSAAYGSAFNYHVDIFRWARDTILLSSYWGQELVQAYYDNSKPLSDIIRQSSTLQTITRTLLWPVAIVLYSLKALMPYIYFVFAIIMILLSTIFIYRKNKHII